MHEQRQLAVSEQAAAVVEARRGAAGAFAAAAADVVRDKPDRHAAHHAPAQDHAEVQLA